ncbi:hypothetical protein WYO_0070 [Methylobacterium sp. GXF4]|jgi:hypothetical protein|uniref:helix-turn-helix domain-containing protein n=1 Tax=Methylobacterium sp. GXF4 TaxID=1096546 RepID=UPI00026985BA|nr:helix-turn-helix domain-containing protein [Methylobacterium sp. GXF4]EIZ87206.1 hypothetical protein WYO_0070 [Methylobacterium sp. GXF4]
METLRPRATRRLRQTLTGALDEADRIEPADVAVLLGRISALAHGVRFLIYAILVRHDGALSAKAIAALSRQRTSTVLRNLHVLIAERLIEVEDDGRGGRFFSADRSEAAKLAAFFAGRAEKDGHPALLHPRDPAMPGVA